MNIIDAVCLSGYRLKAGGSTLQLDGPVLGAQDNQSIKLGIRPEHLLVSEPGPSSLPAQVDFSEYLGSTQFLHCTLGSGETVIVERRGAAGISANEQINLAPDAKSLRFFSMSGDRLR